MSKRKADRERLTEAILTEDGKVLLKNPDGTYRLAEDQTDWARLNAMTEQEVEAIAAADEDSPPMTDEEWMQAVRVPSKTPVTLRVDADVLAFFKAQGKGYQTRMNAVLRAYAEAQQQGHRQPVD